MGQESSVGIATRYGLDVPGIESRWVARFSVPFQTGPEAHPAPYIMGTVSFPGVKRSGRGVDHPLPCSNEVTERVIPPAPSRPVPGSTLTSFPNLIFGFIYTCFYAASVQEKEIITSSPIMPITIAEDSAVTECESGFLASMLPLWRVFLLGFFLAFCVSLINRLYAYLFMI